MPKTTRRANTNELDRLHRLTTLALVAELERLRKAKEPVPAALLTASIKLLVAAGNIDPERPTKRPDRLAGLLNEFEQDEQRDSNSRGSVPDFNVGRIDPPARSLPEDQ
jgi:hypothetical protein